MTHPHHRTAQLTPIATSVEPLARLFSAYRDIVLSERGQRNKAMETENEATSVATGCDVADPGRDPPTHPPEDREEDGVSQGEIELDLTVAIRSGSADPVHHPPQQPPTVSVLVVTTEQTTQESEPLNLTTSNPTVDHRGYGPACRGDGVPVTGPDSPPHTGGGGGRLHHQPDHLQQQDDPNMSASDVLMSSFTVLEEGDPMQLFRLQSQTRTAPFTQHVSGDQYVQGNGLTEYDSMWHDTPTDTTPTTTSALLTALCAPVHAASTPNTGGQYPWKHEPADCRPPPVNSSDQITALLSENVSADLATNNVTNWEFHKQGETGSSLVAYSGEGQRNTTSLPERRQDHESLAQSREAVADTSGLVTSKEFLSAQIGDESRDDERPFSCNQCPKRFSLPRKLDHHLKTEHDGAVVYTCFTCGKKFSNSFSLRDHVSTHANDPITCTLCNMRLSSSKELRAHHKSNHPIPTLECSICRKSFPTMTSRASHLRSAHRGDSRLFSCNICGDPFTDKQVLLEHLRSHISGSNGAVKDEQPVQTTCHVCSTAFEDEEAFKEHVTNNHPNTSNENETTISGRPCENGSRCEVGSVPQYELLRLLLSNDTKQEALRIKQEEENDHMNMMSNSTDNRTILSAETVQHVADELHMLQSMKRASPQRPKSQGNFRNRAKSIHKLPPAIMEGEAVIAGVNISTTADTDTTLRILEKQKTLVNKLQGTVASIIERQMKYPSVFELLKSPTSQASVPTSGSFASGTETSHRSKYHNKVETHSKTHDSSIDTSQSALSTLLQLPPSTSGSAPLQQVYDNLTDSSPNSSSLVSYLEKEHKSRLHPIPQSSFDVPVSQQIETKSVHEMTTRQNSLEQSLLEEFGQTLNYSFSRELALAESRTDTLGLADHPVQFPELSEYTNDNSYYVSWESRDAMCSMEAVASDETHVLNLSRPNVDVPASQPTLQIHMSQTESRSHPQLPLLTADVSEIIAPSSIGMVLDQDSESASSIRKIMLDHQKQDSTDLQGSMISQLDNQQATGISPHLLSLPFSEASEFPASVELLRSETNSASNLTALTSETKHMFLYGDTQTEVTVQSAKKVGAHNRGENAQIMQLQEGRNSQELSDNCHELTKISNHPPTFGSNTLECHRLQHPIPISSINNHEVGYQTLQPVKAHSPMVVDNEPGETIQNRQSFPRREVPVRCTPTLQSNAFAEQCISPKDQTTSVSQNGLSSPGLQNHFLDNQSPAQRTSWDKHIESLLTLFENSVPNFNEKTTGDMFGSNFGQSGHQPPMQPVASVPVTSGSGYAFQAKQSTSATSNDESSPADPHRGAYGDGTSGGLRTEDEHGPYRPSHRSSHSYDENFNLGCMKPSVYSEQSSGTKPDGSLNTRPDTSECNILKSMLSSGGARPVHAPLVVRHKLLAGKFHSQDQTHVKVDSIVDEEEAQNFSLPSVTSDLRLLQSPDNRPSHTMPPKSGETGSSQPWPDHRNGQFKYGLLSSPSTIDHSLLSAMIYPTVVPGQQHVTDDVTHVANGQATDLQCLQQTILGIQPCGHGNKNRTHRSRARTPRTAKKTAKSFQARNMKVVLRRVDTKYNIIHGRVTLSAVSTFESCKADSSGQSVKLKQSPCVSKSSGSDTKRAYYKKGAYQCDICNKVYAWKNYLRKHLAIHTRTKIE